MSWRGLNCLLKSSKLYNGAFTNKSIRSSGKIRPTSFIRYHSEGPKVIGIGKDEDSIGGDSPKFFQDGSPKVMKGNATPNPEDKVIAPAGSPFEILTQIDHGNDSTNEEYDHNDYLTTIFENSEPYMDTYKVYTQLIDAGFSAPQADQIINLVIVQLNSKLSKLSSKYSQTYELENEKYLFESAQEELRVDVTRSRESYINESINLINALERDFQTLSDELNNEYIQMKNDIQVAMNDQNSENTLHSKKISLSIQETNHKISTELNSAMRSEIESLRWHISRWGIIAILVSVFSGCTMFYVHKMKIQNRQEKEEFIPLVIYEPSEFDEDDYHTDIDVNDVK